MVHNVLQTACCVIVVVLCIGRGDGKWKEKDRETLRHDIELYKRMADKIEREIETFYDEYPEEKLEDDNINSMRYKYTAKSFQGQESPLLNKLNINLKNITNTVYNSTNDKKKSTNDHINVNNHSFTTNPRKSEDTKWPTFADILLSIGKKYDWKNDRWIKVKEKLNRPTVRINREKADRENSVDLHEKHKFSYRLIKLNRSKNRRSVVVAVSAVR
ncbi:uncharacterized protein LOC101736340 [Bombyx mori]|uniref:Uncharacterized protein n=2 Tax=Bombyx mori TaxID=7091 RepID=A0A8R2QZT6_BOMMO|nr:uncharacterized protein LOC101736340 isoform X1 [Bombyx mori]XP_037872959.1 uncharacterized protein LOC101736340 isoform X1 [Bombyx mori]